MPRHNFSGREALREDVIKSYDFTPATASAKIALWFGGLAIGYLIARLAIAHGMVPSFRVETGPPALEKLNNLTFFLVALLTFHLRASFVIILRWQHCGSNIDLASRQIIWWQGRPPLTKNVVAVDRVQRITFEHPLLAESKFVLWGPSGFKAELPLACLRSPKEWLHALNNAFSHVDIKAALKALETD